jgi:beta-lactam-binding protein with PASTA domain
VPDGAASPGRRLVVAANIEPDANHDGYGDETQQCRVPSVKKLTKAKAKKALEAAGCKLGKVKKKKLRHFTKKSKKNRVRKQSLAVGQVKPIGTVVDITINAKKKTHHKKK